MKHLEKCYCMTFYSFFIMSLTALAANLFLSASGISAPMSFTISGFLHRDQ
jgi:surface polysaccharide O-acyltransferase-like enzyme